MRLAWKRVATAAVLVVVSNIASVQVAHAATSGRTVQAAVAANVALRGTAATTTDSSGTVTSKAFATPSAAVAGDLLVASLTYKTPGLSDIANTAPSGWTKIPGELFDIATTTGSHLAVAVKPAAGGGETATWTFASPPAGMVISVLAYSGADTTIDPANGVYPFEKFGYKVEAGGSSTATHTAPAFTPTVAGSWGYAAFGARASETWTPGTGLTERSDTRAATSAQATLETNDSNGPIATGSPITYSSTENAGTSVEVSFGGNIKPSGQAPPPQSPTVTTGSATAITSHRRDHLRHRQPQRVEHRPTTSSTAPPRPTGPKRPHRRFGRIRHRRDPGFGESQRPDGLDHLPLPARCDQLSRHHQRLRRHVHDQSSYTASAADRDDRQCHSHHQPTRDRLRHRQPQRLEHHLPLRLRHHHLVRNPNTDTRRFSRIRHRRDPGLGQSQRPDGLDDLPLPAGGDQLSGHHQRLRRHLHHHRRGRQRFRRTVDVGRWRRGNRREAGEQAVVERRILVGQPVRHGQPDPPHLPAGSHPPRPGSTPER